MRDIKVKLMNLFLSCLLNSLKTLCQELLQSSCICYIEFRAFDFKFFNSFFFQSNDIMPINYKSFRYLCKY